MNIKNIKLSKIKKIAMVIGLIGTLQTISSFVGPKEIVNNVKAVEEPGNQRVKDYFLSNEEYDISKEIEKLNDKYSTKFAKISAKDLITDLSAEDIQEQLKARLKGRTEAIIKSAATSGIKKAQLEAVRKEAEEYNSELMQIIQKMAGVVGKKKNLTMSDELQYEKAAYEEFEALRSVFGPTLERLNTAQANTVAKVIFMGKILEHIEKEYNPNQARKVFEYADGQLDLVGFYLWKMYQEGTTKFSKAIAYAKGRNLNSFEIADAKRFREFLTMLSANITRVKNSYQRIPNNSPNKRNVNVLVALTTENGRQTLIQNARNPQNNLHNDVSEAILYLFSVDQQQIPTNQQRVMYDLMLKKLLVKDGGEAEYGSLYNQRNARIMLDNNQNEDKKNILAETIFSATEYIFSVDLATRRSFSNKVSNEKNIARQWLQKGRPVDYDYLKFLVADKTNESLIPALSFSVLLDLGKSEDGQPNNYLFELTKVLTGNYQYSAGANPVTGEPYLQQANNIYKVDGNLFAKLNDVFPLGDENEASIMQAIFEKDKQAADMKKSVEASSGIKGFKEANDDKFTYENGKLVYGSNTHINEVLKTQIDMMNGMFIKDKIKFENKKRSGFEDILNKFYVGSPLFMTAGRRGGEVSQLRPVILNALGKAEAGLLKLGNELNSDEYLEEVANAIENVTNEQNRNPHQDKINNNNNKPNDDGDSEINLDDDIETTKPKNYTMNRQQINNDEKPENLRMRRTNQNQQRQNQWPNNENINQRKDGQTPEMLRQMYLKDKENDELKKQLELYKDQLQNKQNEDKILSLNNGEYFRMPRVETGAIKFKKDLSLAIQQVIEILDNTVANNDIGVFNTRGIGIQLKKLILMGYIQNIIQLNAEGKLASYYPGLLKHVVDIGDAQYIENASNGMKKIKNDVLLKLMEETITTTTREWESNENFDELYALTSQMIQNNGQITNAQLLGPMQGLYMVNNYTAVKIGRNEYLTEKEMENVAELLSENSQKSLKTAWDKAIKRIYTGNYYGRPGDPNYSTNLSTLARRGKILQQALTEKARLVFTNYFRTKASSSLKKRIDRHGITLFQEEQMQDIGSFESMREYNSGMQDKYKALSEEKSDEDKGWSYDDDSWKGRRGLREKTISDIKKTIDQARRLFNSLGEALEDMNIKRGQLGGKDSTSQENEIRRIFESAKVNFAKNVFTILNQLTLNVKRSAIVFKKSIAKMKDKEAREMITEGIKEYARKFVVDSTTTSIKDMLRTIYKSVGSIDYDDLDEEDYKSIRKKSAAKKIRAAIMKESEAKGVKRSTLIQAVTKIMTMETIMEFVRQNIAREIYTIANYNFFGTEKEKLKKWSDLELSKKSDKTPIEQMKEIIEKMLSELGGSYGSVKRLSLSGKGFLEKDKGKEITSAREKLKELLEKRYKMLEEALQSDMQEDEDQEDEAETEAETEDENENKEEEVKGQKEDLIKIAEQKGTPNEESMYGDGNASMSPAKISYKEENGRIKVQIRNVSKPAGTQLKVIPILGKDGAQPPIVATENGGIFEAELPFGMNATEKAVHLYRTNEVAGAPDVFVGATVINNIKDFNKDVIENSKVFGVKFYDGNDAEKEDYMQAAAYELQDSYYVHVKDAKGKNLVDYLAVAIGDTDGPDQDSRIMPISYGNGEYGIFIPKRILKTYKQHFTIHLYKGTFDSGAFDCYMKVMLQETPTESTKKEEKGDNEAAKEAEQTKEDEKKKDKKKGKKDKKDKKGKKDEDEEDEDKKDKKKNKKDDDEKDDDDDDDFDEDDDDDLDDDI